MIRQLRWQIALGVAGAAIIGALLLLVSNRAFRDEPARGGQFIEAMVGQPRTFNPLFADDDSEIDLTRLLFSGLTRPAGDGSVRPDLADHWAISPDGKTYTFTLKSGLVWHDQQPVTADDLVFTARLAADRNIPDVQKSRLAEPWQRATVEKIDDLTVAVHLEEAYAPFLNAAMLGILPAHLLADVPPAQIAEHPFSVRSPVGTGPYRLESLEDPEGPDGYRVQLARFDEHWAAGDQTPYLDRLVFQFYPALDKAVAALGERSAQGLGRVPAALMSRLGAEGQTQNRAAVQAGYTLVYLNPSEPAFTNRSVRQALSLALDRKGIVDDPALLNGQGVPAVSPIPPGSWAHDPSLPEPRFDLDAARRILDESGWIDSDGDGVRDRDGQPLSFTLGTRGDDPMMVAIAERIQRDWSSIGIGVEVKPIDRQDLAETLRNRAYAALLLDWETREYDPDPYALWHSSQIDFPGQNFAGFKNTEADRLLVEARQANPESEIDKRRSLYQAFQRIFAEELPALMLYHPAYQYVVTDGNVGGIQLPELLVEPADRFATLSDWFVQTQRVFGESAADADGS